MCLTVNPSRHELQLYNVLLEFRTTQCRRSLKFVVCVHHTCYILSSYIYYPADIFTTAAQQNNYECGNAFVQVLQSRKLEVNTEYTVKTICEMADVVASNILRFTE